MANNSDDLRINPEHDHKTLSCIEAVLRIYWSPEPFDIDDSTLSWLKQHGLIKRDTSRNDWWATTERAATYVEAIRHLSLPVQKWVMP